MSIPTYFYSHIMDDRSSPQPSTSEVRDILENSDEAISVNIDDLEADKGSTSHPTTPRSRPQSPEVTAPPKVKWFYHTTEQYVQGPINVFTYIDIKYDIQH